MTTIAFIQARMGSTRLPGKVLEDLSGSPVLLRVVERLGAAQRVDRVVVLTSMLPRDDQIVEVCSAKGVEVMRGSESDVLDRFAAATAAYKPDIVVRITADCPLIDPVIVDKVVSLVNGGGPAVFASVATGALPADAGRRRYPDGLDAEAIRADVLAIAAAEAHEHFDREHVTPFIWKRPERFTAAMIEADEDMGNLHWTLDYPCDLDLIRTIYDRLDNRGKPFGFAEVKELLESEPQLLELNEGRGAPVRSR